MTTFLPIWLQGLTPYQQGDILYYVAFLVGQLLFLLNRASSAIRSKSNPIKSRSAYISANWDILLTRIALEAGVFIYARHIGVSGLIAIFTTWKMPVQIPQSGFSFGCMGYAVDSLVDWYAVSNKCPVWLQKWIKENIPSVVTYQSHTTQSGTDPKTGAPVTVEQTTTVEKTTPGK